MSHPLKRDRQPDHSPPAKEGKTIHYKCVVCSGNVENDCISCDWCGQWEHSKCAGLTGDELKVLFNINTSVKFFCKVCVSKVEVAFKFFEDIQEKQNSIAAKMNVIEEKLSTSVADLNSRLVQFKNQLTSVASQPTAKGTQMSTVTPQSPSAMSNQPAPVSKSPVSNNFTDRKFNVVVYGIQENPTGTPRHDRTKTDMNSCVNILKKASDDISELSIRDCLRLGKFNSSRIKPRPLLVKLSCAFDVVTILTNRSKIPGNIQIKPDLNKEERLREQLLLKERWSLICSGIDKKLIKIRGATLYVEGQIYGEVTNSTFIFKSRNEASNSSNNNSIESTSRNKASNSSSNNSEESTSSNDTPTFANQFFRYRSSIS